MVLKNSLLKLKGKCVGALVFLITLLLTFTAYADDPPDEPGDGDCGTSPDDPCQLPLDTWIYILVILALIYTVYHLHKKQKAFSV